MAEKIAVTVLGSGSFGTSLANVLADNGHSVTLWGRDPAVARSIQKTHRNPKYLSEVELNSGLQASSSLTESIQRCSVVVCAIPTQKIREVLRPVASEIGSRTLINCSKGIEVGTELTVSGIINELAPGCHYGILSGPSFAIEVARRLPTAVTAASQDGEIAELAQRLFTNRYFRVYSSRDVIGVELAGAIKNVIAIGSGVVTGLKLGYNAQAAIINRGVAEMARLAAKKHADPLTFLGLAGMGDLVLTCTGPLSRNRTVGVLLGEGKPLAEIERTLGGVAEGVYTAKSVHALAIRLSVDMPIAEQAYRILYEGQTCKQALEELMARDPKVEWS